MDTNKQADFSLLYFILLSYFQIFLFVFSFSSIKACSSAANFFAIIDL